MSLYVGLVGVRWFICRFILVYFLYVGLCRYMSVYVVVCQCMIVYVCVCRYISENTGVCQYMSIVGACQYTLVYVGLRCTSLYIGLCRFMCMWYVYMSMDVGFLGVC